VPKTDFTNTREKEGQAMHTPDGRKRNPKKNKKDKIKAHGETFREKKNKIDNNQP
jgi:hypothetical protein